MNAKQRQHALAVKTTHCNNGLVMWSQKLYP